MVAAKMPRRPVELVDSPKAARRALNKLWAATKDGSPFALDSEFDPDETLVSFSFSWGAGIRYVAEAETLPSFADWFGDRAARVWYSFFKADAKVFRKMGLDLRPSFGGDIVSMDFLRDENTKKHGLKQQVRRWLGRKRKEFKELFSYVPPGKKKAKQLDASQVAGRTPLPEEALLKHSKREWREIFEEYGGDDAEDTWLLGDKHRRALQAMGYWPNYLRIDRPYTLTLMACEDRGMLVDLEGMDRIRALALVHQARAEHAFRAAIGHPDLNLEAKEQVKAILFDELGWPKYDDLRTKKTRDYQMTKLTIVRWIAEGVDLAEVLQRRGVYAKLAKDLKSLMAGTSADGRLRSDYNQQGAATGRISSRKWKVRVVETRLSKRGIAKTIVKNKAMGANLQNVVSPGAKDPWGVKDQFIAPAVGQMTARGVPAEEDHELIVVDMSGFELLLLIHWTRHFVPHMPTRMLEVMEKHGSPSACHALTTIEAFDLAIEMEDWETVKKLFPDQYRVGKEMNFGLGYKGTWRTLARRRQQDTRSPKVERENKRLVAHWNGRYPEVVEYQKAVIAFGYEHGWTPTISGRRQHVAEGLASIDEGEREHWERKCTNGPVQGSAADIIKVAMNRIEEDEELRAAGFSQLAQVHDEIVGEAPKSTAQFCLERVNWHMTQPFKKQLHVKLSTEGKRARTWKLAK